MTSTPGALWRLILNMVWTLNSSSISPPSWPTKKNLLVLSNYIFELLEVNPGGARVLIQLHLEDVDAVLEFVTAHAEKGAGLKTTPYVGQEEEEEVEGEVEEVVEVGAGREKDNPHNPLMISVQKVRIQPGKGQGKWDGLFPQPLTHNTPKGLHRQPRNQAPHACTFREPAISIRDSRYRKFHLFLLYFARDLVPSCAFVVLSSPEVRSNKCVQIRGLK